MRGMLTNNYYELMGATCERCQKHAYVGSTAQRHQCHGGATSKGGLTIQSPVHRQQQPAARVFEFICSLPLWPRRDRFIRVYLQAAYSKSKICCAAVDCSTVGTESICYLPISNLQYTVGIDHTSTK